MSVPTQDEKSGRRRDGKGRPIAILIAAIVGLGGLGLAAGAALGSVGGGSPSTASTHHDCPYRAGHGPGYGSP